MSTVETPVRSEAPPGCVVLRDVSWEFYERFLEETCEQRVRHAYDGDLVIMAPIGIGHESPKKIIAQLVEALTEAWRIPRKSVDSLTLRSRPKRRGAEPDEGYFLRENAQRMRGRKKCDPEVDPVPDLLIEIDRTNPSFYRLPIYAVLGVPEVWRWDGETLEVHLLVAEGDYAVSPTSRAFPTLPMAEFTRWIERADEIDETDLVRDFRAWAASIRPEGDAEAT